MSDRAQRDDTLFGSLLRARDEVSSLSRALAGLRDGTEWVELTYDELVADVETVSAHLAALGLGRGDVLCIQLPNWTEAVVYTYAAARIGAVVCPITTIYRERELTFILERTECKVVVVPSTYRGFDYAAMITTVQPSLPNLQHVIAVGAPSSPEVLQSSLLLQRAAAEMPPVAQPDPGDLAILAFTSGTTGESKGVMHSSASIHAAIDDLASHAGYGRGMTSLVMSPFGHLTGFTWGILMPLRLTGDVVLLESWDPAQALDLVDRYDVSFTMGATPFLSDLLDTAGEGTHFPEVFVCGGAPIPPALVEQAVGRFGCRVVSVWGMSEYPVGTATAVTDSPVLAATTDGRPAGRAEIVIRNGQGAPATVGDEGDLLIRGPGRFLGYYRRPDLDEAAIDDGGFLDTGDRARLLDEAGHIRISGRTKDIIIRGGENIPVIEIENLLLRHPAIREVALIPLPHPRLGETACACVVLESAAVSPTIAELGAFLGTHGVAKQFYPEALQVMAGLPRTPSGKIQKFALRDQVTP